MAESKFYYYSQNNSGGFFDGDYHYVYIEADNETESDKIAEESPEVNIYFDGCSNGYDCDCCGDRWYRAYDFLTEDEMILELCKTPDTFHTRQGMKKIIIYKNGKFEVFG